MELSYECEMTWDDLKGDSPRKRFCADCENYVFNISAMTSAQKRELIEEHKGELCVRFLQRDGKVLHTDDWEGQLASQQDGLRRLLLAAAIGSPIFIAAALAIAPNSVSDGVDSLGEAYQFLVSSIVEEEECDLKFGKANQAVTGVVF
mgnify:CR=1 FL=1